MHMSRYYVIETTLRCIYVDPALLNKINALYSLSDLTVFG